MGTHLTFGLVCTVGRAADTGAGGPGSTGGTGYISQWRLVDTLNTMETLKNKPEAYLEVARRSLASQRTSEWTGTRDDGPALTTEQQGRARGDEGGAGRAGSESKMGGMKGTAR